MWQERFQQLWLDGWCVFPKTTRVSYAWQRCIMLNLWERADEDLPYSEGPLPPWIMNLNDGCRMEGCLLIVTAWYGLHFARNHSTLGAYSRVQWILSPRTVHWFFFRDALRNSFGSEDPHFPDISKILQSQKPRLGGKSKSQGNNTISFSITNSWRHVVGVAMLVMSHTKVIVTSAETSMSL